MTPTPPKAPPAPPSAAKTPATAPTVADAPKKPVQPLELRFPRLYYDFETVTEDGKTKDVFVPKKTPPTLADVIHAVCQSHGTSDRGLIGDLNVSIGEFLGVEAVKLRAVVPVAPVTASPEK